MTQPGPDLVATPLLNDAVTDAVHLIRKGKPGRAEYHLTRACMAADRLIDLTNPSPVEVTHHVADVSAV